MGIFIGWFIFSCVVAWLGDDRKIGLWAAFFLSLLLSPLIGIIIVLMSDKKYPAQVVVRKSPLDNLVELKKLLDSGAITQEEFEVEKKKILGN